MSAINQKFKNSVIVLAPMAGITDAPFRKLCIKFGASAAISEMIQSDSVLYTNKKTILKISDNLDGYGLKVIQISGFDPNIMLKSVNLSELYGVDVVDINMGCPAKKVCNVFSGAALLKNELLIFKILNKIVKLSSVPVTLKIRLGWDKKKINAISVSKIAESAGISLLTVHGRSRNCFFKGLADYDIIGEINNAVRIPVLVNGDIMTPLKARHILNYTNSSGVMIGRGALGNPWIFKEILYHLRTNNFLSGPSKNEVKKIVTEHLYDIYCFYGEYFGVRIARKHVSWYSKFHCDSSRFRNKFNELHSSKDQLMLIEDYFN